MENIKRNFSEVDYSLYITFVTYNGRSTTIKVDKDYNSNQIDTLVLGLDNLTDEEKIRLKAMINIALNGVDVID